MASDDAVLSVANGTTHVNPNGNETHRAHVNGSVYAGRNGSTQEDDLPRLKHPIHAERHMRIACVGAGASGLLLAYKLQRSFDNFELVLYEKNDDISGTWYENKYPGCVLRSI